MILLFRRFFRLIEAGDTSLSIIPYICVCTYMYIHRRETDRKKLKKFHLFFNIGLVFFNEYFNSL